MQPFLSQKPTFPTTLLILVFLLSLSQLKDAAAGWHFGFLAPFPSWHLPSSTPFALLKPSALPARGARHLLHCSSSLLSPQSFTLSQTQNLGLHQPFWHLNCWSVQAEKGEREIRGETPKGTSHPAATASTAASGES